MLDEATSALDSEDGSGDPGRTLTLMAGKTVIAIAHSLSTIAALDRLVVLDHGRIVEEGTHAELIRGRPLCVAMGAPVRRLPRARPSGGSAGGGAGRSGAVRATDGNGRRAPEDKRRSREPG